jgi:hypothetical protein
MDGYRLWVSDWYWYDIGNGNGKGTALQLMAELVPGVPPMVMEYVSSQLH